MPQPAMQPNKLAIARPSNEPFAIAQEITDAAAIRTHPTRKVPRSRASA